MQLDKEMQVKPDRLYLESMLRNTENVQGTLSSLLDTYETDIVTIARVIVAMENIYQVSLCDLLLKITELSNEELETEIMKRM